MNFNNYVRDPVNRGETVAQKKARKEAEKLMRKETALERERELNMRFEVLMDSKTRGVPNFAKAQRIYRRRYVNVRNNLRQVNRRVAPSPQTFSR